MATQKQDQFLSEATSIDSLIRGLRSDIKNKESAQKKGENISKLNLSIQQQMNVITNKINTISGIVSGWDNDPQDVSREENDRRRKRVNDYKNELQKLNDQFTGASAPTQRFTPSVQQKYGDGADPTTLTVEQMQKDRKDLEGQRGQTLTETLDSVSELKSQQFIMKKELDYQNNELIPQVQGRVDNNLLKMKKTNTKVDKILKKGSDCQLWMCLVCEAIILIFLLINN
jgi:hypothetical protein